MNVRLDRLWAADRLPPWCRVIYRTDDLVEYGTALTDAVYDGGEWIDVRRPSPMPDSLSEAVIELEGVVVSSGGALWREGRPVVSKRWGLLNRGPIPTDLARDQHALVELSAPHAGIIAPPMAFGHWLLHRLPRLHSLTRAGAALNLLSNALPWNDQPLFDAFGIAPTSVVRLRRAPIQLARVDRLVLATHASLPLSERRIDSARLARLIDDLTVRWGAELSRAETPADVYITRRTGQGEREGCQNPDELERFFADQGYAVIYPPDLTLAEQFALAHRARSVVGETGSGVMWAMACASGASVTYITPRSGNFDQEYDPDRKGWARAIADARGLHFGQIIASTSTTRKRWSADIDQVKSAWFSRPETLAPLT